MVQTRKRNTVNKGEENAFKKPRREKRKSAPMKDSGNLPKETSENESKSLNVDRKSSRRHTFTNLGQLSPLAVVNEEDTLGSEDTATEDEKRKKSPPLIDSGKLLPETIENEGNSLNVDGKSSRRHTFTNLGQLPSLAIVNEEDTLGSEDTATEDEKDDVCSMERKMQKNIRDNANFFAKLGISSAKVQLEEARDADKTKPSSRGLKENKKKVAEVLPRRQSLRIQNRDPEGGDLPERPVVERFGFSSEQDLRKEGPLVMKEVLRSTDLQDAHGKFWEEMNSLSSQENVDLNRKEVNSDLKRFLRETDKMQMTELRVAKVVPNRIFSVAIHPTESKVLVVAGGKWGKVGFWDVNSREGHDGVLCYEPHVRPVKYLKFQADQPDHLYSCSYDGLLRCCHFETGTFDQVYSTPEEDDVMLTGFDFLTPTSLIVSQGDGRIVMVDTRSGSEKGVQRVDVAKKVVRSVSIHPLNANYLATSSADCTVKIWDLRQLKKQRAEPLHVLPHSKTLESAYFSPLTGKHLLTTAMDDRLRLYDTSDIAKGASIAHSIRHNNHTGRWLSKFRASWHPAREDLFICGSMARPRQIELFDTSGSIVKTFRDDDFLNSVCSLNAFHPTRNILVGGNSSGRMHVFM